MKEKFRMLTDGYHTYAELDGKSIGRGIYSVKYTHDLTEGSEKTKPHLVLEIDLDEFEFMPDGYFDEAQKKLQGLDKQCTPTP